MTGSATSLRASIVIPTWNRRELLEEVLESLLTQVLVYGGIRSR